MVAHLVRGDCPGQLSAVEVEEDIRQLVQEILRREAILLRVLHLGGRQGGGLSTALHLVEKCNLP